MILIGRGATVVTARLPNVFHVRLVAPLEQRINHRQQILNLSLGQAMAQVSAEDKGRARYLRTYFGKNIDDPLLYHLVLNTGGLSFDESAQIIGDAVIRHFHLERNLPAQPVSAAEILSNADLYGK